MAASDLQQVVALTDAYRQAQFKQAGTIAALVAAYYRSRLDFADPAAVQRWLDIMVPRILQTSSNTANLAAAYGNALRKIEAPGAPAFTFTPVQPAVTAQVEKSLLVVGPYAYENKMRQIDEMRETGHTKAGVPIKLSDADVTALKQKALKDTTTGVLGTSLRHAQQGGRATTYNASQNDRVAIGWIRITKAVPCFFCAMLASRGIEWGPYSEHSFDRSDARFVGDGEAKVHDHCACAVKPVYTTDDPLLDRTKVFENLWYEHSTGSGRDAINSFRKGYQVWADENAA